MSLSCLTLHKLSNSLIQARIVYYRAAGDLSDSNADNEHHDNDNDDDDDADNNPNDREDDWRHSHLTSRLRLLTSTAICDHYTQSNKDVGEFLQCSPYIIR